GNRCLDRSSSARVTGQSRTQPRRHIDILYDIGYRTVETLHRRHIDILYDIGYRTVETLHRRKGFLAGIARFQMRTSVGHLGKIEIVRVRPDAIQNFKCGLTVH
ncbi:MAG: hypothetical protein ACI93T_003415, partial [Porticoccaceae bacterium]